MKKRWYIAYGSNLNLRQMAMRCPTARLLGTGLVENGNENLYGTVRALLNGKCGEDEMTAVSEAAERQRMYLKEAIEAELSAVKEIGVRAEELTGTLYQLGR